MSEPQQYMGAILAAGHGTRMAPFSSYYPKPILPVCNKPMIQYQIEMMKKAGIYDIVILIGHKGYEITRILGDGRDMDVRIRYIEQTSMLGIAHAVGRLEPYIDKPFLLFLGDIFFVPKDIQLMFRMFEEQGGGAVLAVKEENSPDAIRKNYSVKLSEDGYVQRVIEKPRYTHNKLKGVGLYLFDISAFDAIRRTPRTAMRDEYEITESIQVIIDDGNPVRVANAVHDDINLTTPVDLLNCNLIQVEQSDVNSIVGEDTKLHPEVKLENSIIGSNVTIKYPISITDTVIFSNTCVASKSDFERYIVTPDCIVDCKHEKSTVSVNL